MQELLCTSACSACAACSAASKEHTAWWLKAQPYEPALHFCTADEGHLLHSNPQEIEHFEEITVVALVAITLLLGSKLCCVRTEGKSAQ